MKGKTIKGKNNRRILADPAYSRDRKEFAQRFAAARQAAGFTQNSLAKALGITQSQVSHIENGRAQPEAVELPLLCKVLHISAEELLAIKPYFPKRIVKAIEAALE